MKPEAFQPLVHVCRCKEDVERGSREEVGFKLRLPSSPWGPLSQVQEEILPKAWGGLVLTLEPSFQRGSAFHAWEGRRSSLHAEKFKNTEPSHRCCLETGDLWALMRWGQRVSGAGLEENIQAAAVSLGHPASGRLPPSRVLGTHRPRGTVHTPFAISAPLVTF